MDKTIALDWIYDITASKWSSRSKIKRIKKVLKKLGYE